MRQSRSQFIKRDLAAETQERLANYRPNERISKSIGSRIGDRIRSLVSWLLPKPPRSSIKVISDAEQIQQDFGKIPHNPIQLFKQYQVTSTIIAEQDYSLKPQLQPQVPKQPKKPLKDGAISFTKFMEKEEKRRERSMITRKNQKFLLRRFLKQKKREETGDVLPQRYPEPPRNKKQKLNSSKVELQFLLQRRNQKKSLIFQQVREFDVIDFGDVVVRKLPLDVKDVSSCESSISEDFRESMIQKVSKDNSSFIDDCILIDYQKPSKVKKSLNNSMQQLQKQPVISQKNGASVVKRIEQRQPNKQIELKPDFIVETQAPKHSKPILTTNKQNEAKQMVPPTLSVPPILSIPKPPQITIAQETNMLSFAKDNIKQITENQVNKPNPINPSGLFKNIPSQQDGGMFENIPNPIVNTSLPKAPVSLFSFLSATQNQILKSETQASISVPKDIFAAPLNVQPEQKYQEVQNVIGQQTEPNRDDLKVSHQVPVQQTQQSQEQKPQGIFQLNIPGESVVPSTRSDSEEVKKQLPGEKTSIFANLLTSLSEKQDPKPQSTPLITSNIMKPIEQQGLTQNAPLFAAQVPERSSLPSTVPSGLFSNLIAATKPDQSPFQISQPLGQPTVVPSNSLTIANQQENQVQQLPREQQSANPQYETPSKNSHARENPFLQQSPEIDQAHMSKFFSNVQPLPQPPVMSYTQQPAKVQEPSLFSSEQTQSQMFQTNPATNPFFTPQQQNQPFSFNQLQGPSPIQQLINQPPQQYIQPVQSSLFNQTPQAMFNQPNQLNQSFAPMNQIQNSFASGGYANTSFSNSQNDQSMDMDVNPPPIPQFLGQQSFSQNFMPSQPSNFRPSSILFGDGNTELFRPNTTMQPVVGSLFNPVSSDQMKRPMPQMDYNKRKGKPRI